MKEQLDNFLCFIKKIGYKISKRELNMNEQLDEILCFILKQPGYKTPKREFKNNNLYDKEKIQFLCNDKLLRYNSAETVEMYELTIEGIAFTANGGYVGAEKKKKNNKLLNNPIVTFLTHFLAIFLGYLLANLTK